jgi:D-alanyl-D-alanine carboxypeptidase (penicillin-binding protein 5/6)
VSDQGPDEFGVTGPGAGVARRSTYRRRRIVVLSVILVLLLCVIYAATTVFAALPPVAAVSSQQKTITQTAAQLAWPAGSTGGAVGAVGYDGLLAQTGTTASVPIASMTKTITALMILQAKPIAAGTDGPTITYTDSDVEILDQVQAEDGSWAPVESGEQQSEKQSLTSMLLPSANNYAISLATWAYGSVDAYLSATNDWLAKNGFSGTHITDPSGLDPGSVSTTTDLIGIAKLVLANPVLASIVGTKTADLPGAGDLKNGNELLGHDGIDGIKTGFTDQAGHCLMFSADATIGGQKYTIVGVVLGLGQYQDLWNGVPPLLDSVKSGFHVVKLTGTGASFGSYTTQWGKTTDVVSTAPSQLVVWSNTPITVAVRTRPVRLVTKGENLGTVTFTLGKTVVTKPLEAATTLPDPGFWWRLTHPGVLF